MDELKFHLLAKSCLCPGVNYIISHLITSNKPRLIANPQDEWVDEYFHGLDHEMYRIPLDEGYEGLNFSQVAFLLYQQHNYTLFALEILVKDELKVFLNPAEYVFPKYKHFGYVLALQMPDVE